jgi:hypothetical protein
LKDESEKKLAEKDDQLEKKSAEVAKLADQLKQLTMQLEDRVRCPVCLEVPTAGPVYSCPNGHCVCAACYQGPASSCPECRVRMHRNKSLLGATVIESIEHACRFDGCLVTTPLAGLEDHKLSCPHRPGYMADCEPDYCDLLCRMFPVPGAGRRAGAGRGAGRGAATFNTGPHQRMPNPPRRGPGPRQATPGSARGGGEARGSGRSAPPPSAAPWVCGWCTFSNLPAARTCALCLSTLRPALLPAPGPPLPPAPALESRLGHCTCRAEGVCHVCRLFRSGR